LRAGRALAPHSRSVPASSLAQGLADTFRSDRTPPFAGSVIFQETTGNSVLYLGQPVGRVLKNSATGLPFRRRVRQVPQIPPARLLLAAGLVGVCGQRGKLQEIAAIQR